MYAGLLSPRKLKIIEDELLRHNKSIYDLAGTYYNQTGFFQRKQLCCTYLQQQYTVTILVSENLNNLVKGYKTINDRCILIILDTKLIRMNVLQVCASSTKAAEEVKQEFYETISEALNALPRREIVVLKGDFNAKTGNVRKEITSTGLLEIMGM